MDSDIPVSVLHERFSYDPDTGELRWKVSVSKAKAGTMAGCKVRKEAEVRFGFHPNHDRG